MARSVTNSAGRKMTNDTDLVQIALQKIMPGVSLPVVSEVSEAVSISRNRVLRRRSLYPFPDVVLLDLNLPLNGRIRLLRLIRQATLN